MSEAQPQNKSKLLDLGDKPSVLFLRHDRIGDALISLPVFRALRQHYPNMRIDVLLSQYNQAMQPALERIVDKGWVYRKSLWSALPLMWQLRRQRYDVVVDMMDNASRTSGLILKFVNARNSVGFAHEEAARVSHSVPLPDRSTVHIIDCMMQLLQPFDINPKTAKVDLSYPFANDSNATSSQTKVYDLYVHLNGSKESLWWGTERFVELLQELMTSQASLKIAVGAGKEKIQELKEICDRTGLTSLSPAASLDELALRVTSARMLLSPDTSLVHMAAGCGLPCVVLYAQAHPHRLPWFPYSVEYRALIASNANGLTSISVEDVIRAVREMMH